MEKLRVAERAVLTVGEFASALGISISCARKMCYTGAVASTKFTARLMIPVGEIQRLISENLTPARPAGER